MACDGFGLVRAAGAPESGLRPILTGLIVALAISACTSAVRPPAPVEGTHSLVIQIRGIDCCQGVLRVALYNGAEYWLNDHGMVRGQAAPVLGTEQIVEFAGLPPGDYAVALYQDLNSNARLDRFLGMVPREPYGFSGNPAGVGRPSFNASKVNVPEVADIIIEMRPPPF